MAACGVCVFGFLSLGGQRNGEGEEVCVWDGCDVRGDDQESGASDADIQNEEGYGFDDIRSQTRSVEPQYGDDGDADNHMEYEEDAVIPGADLVQRGCTEDVEHEEGEHADQDDGLGEFFEYDATLDKGVPVQAHVEVEEPEDYAAEGAVVRVVSFVGGAEEEGDGTKVVPHDQGVMKRELGGGNYAEAFG